MVEVKISFAGSATIIRVPTSIYKWESSCASHAQMPQGKSGLAYPFFGDLEAEPLTRLMKFYRLEGAGITFLRCVFNQ